MRGKNRLTSRCNGEVLNGTAEQIAAAYENKASIAEKSGDRVDTENFKQHAEHWRRHGQE
tara:strand:+ start:18901 stop:19080 length:180 start_codon:yes stop_codon:yes gene_type:complete